MGPELVDLAAEAEPTADREAIVIGSGFGGAVSACRLAQAGFRVLVLERGRRYEARDFPALPVDAQLLPDLKRWTWQGEQGLWDILDLEEIISVQAAGYGGGSLVYANVNLRPPAEVFDDRWPEEYQGGHSLREFYDLVGYMLEAAPISAHERLRDRIVKADQLARAARTLKRDDALFLPPLTIQSRDGENIHGRAQKACTGCGRCCTGCPETAKNTLDFNYLAVAEKYGATVRTQCEVVDIVEKPGGRWEVHCVDHLRAEATCFVTSHLFVCAGSVHSTRLIARARLLPRDVPPGPALAGIGYFPGGDTLGVVYDTKHPQYPSFGPAITTTAVHWEPHRPGSFFLVQDGGYAKELERLIGVLRAPVWVGRNRLSDRGDGRVDRSKMAEPERGLAEPQSSTLLPSPLDALLDAIGAGAAHAIVPEQLRRSAPEFLRELQRAMLFPQVVDRVVDGAMRYRHARWFPFLDADGLILPLFRRFERFLVRHLYGTNDRMGDRALQALLNGSDLPRSEVARLILGYDGESAEHRTMLLGMGRDAASGVLHYDRNHDKLVADLDLFHLAPGYTQQEQLMTDIATTLGGELRTNPAWAFLGKPITVHNQGGCPMSNDPKHGVTTEDGKVHGVDGLYVLDGSILCTSVGVNPSATIAAITERNIRKFLVLHPRNVEGEADYARQVAAAANRATQAARDGWQLTPPQPTRDVPLESQPIGVRFSEVMEGHYSVLSVPESPHLGRRDAEYRRLESRGRPKNVLRVELDVSVANLSRFIEDQRHRLRLAGTIRVLLPGESDVYEGAVVGHLDLFIRRWKPYGIPLADTRRFEAQARLARTYTTRIGAPRPGSQRYMTYTLSIPEKPEWRIKGYKRLRDDPGVDAWRDTSSLFVKLLQRPASMGGRAHAAESGAPPRPILRGAGAIHVALDEFLFRQLHSIEVTGTTDPARITWATMKFATFFFGALQRIYAPGIQTSLEALFRAKPNHIRREPKEPGD